ncbi:paraquat-inducible membrane protein A [bacterium]|nr:paraquat-inducible membrane protein A [bacterium]
MAGSGRQRATLTAQAAHLIGCRTCGRVWPEGTPTCGRCGARLRAIRDGHSLQAVWAWLLAGMVCYVPANLYPMLNTSTLLDKTTNTVIGGAVELWQGGNYGVAAIVFVASVMIPIGKFIAIGWLALAIGHQNIPGRHRHLRLLHIVEFIGRWSMVDVFVVAILSALVQLGVVATIEPGPAAASFALSVAFTMLSAQSFDPRTIWTTRTP